MTTGVPADTKAAVRQQGGVGAANRVGYLKIAAKTGMAMGMKEGHGIEPGETKRTFVSYVIATHGRHRAARCNTPHDARKRSLTMTRKLILGLAAAALVSLSAAGASAKDTVERTWVGSRGPIFNIVRR